MNFTVLKEASLLITDMYLIAPDTEEEFKSYIYILIFYNQILSPQEGKNLTIYVSIPLQLLQSKSYLKSYIFTKNDHLFDNI